MAALLEAESVFDALRYLYRPAHKTKQTPVRLLSRRLGYKSVRLLEMILKGDRLPSADFLARTTTLFSLSDSEQQLLELLTRRERLSRLGRSTVDVTERISRLRRKVVSVKFIEPQFFTLFSDWHCLVIKQLLRGYPEGLGVAEIARKLRNKVSESEVESALHALLHLGFVERGEDPSTFRLSREETLYTRPDLPSQAARKHHRQMMERALEAMEEQSVNERELISLTFSCPATALPRLKAALRKFRDEINAEFSEPSPNVLQLNLQLFSHTK